MSPCRHFSAPVRDASPPSSQLTIGGVWKPSLRCRDFCLGRFSANASATSHRLTVATADLYTATSLCSQNFGCAHTDLFFSPLWLMAALLSKQSVNPPEDRQAAAGDQGSEGGRETKSGRIKDEHDLEQKKKHPCSSTNTGRDKNRRIIKK